MSKRTLAQSFTAWTATVLIACSALLVAGCSTTRVIDSEVTAFQTWNGAPPGPGTTYQFERLPSQQAHAADQAAVEAAAGPALAKVGLVPSATAPRYSVQLLLSTQVVEQVFSDPFGYGAFGGYRGYGAYGYRRFRRYDGFGGYGLRGAALGGFYPMGVFEAATFRHTLAVLMRDNSTQQVTFESRALHDGPWNDTLTILPALLDAALQGFPQPPPGTRLVNVPLLQPAR